MPAAKTGVSRFIVWEWFFVLMLLGGLGVALWMISGTADPKRQAADLVIQMKAAALGRPLGKAVFSSYPTVLRNKREAIVNIDKIPPKICVMVSWDLYRFGTIAVNGTTPTRVSAARLVELCNENDTATITWAARLIN